MVVPQELTPEVWAALPPAVAALLGWQAEQIRILTQRVAELEVKLGKDSTNSSLPPSAARTRTPSRRAPSPGAAAGLAANPATPNTCVPCCRPTSANRSSGVCRPPAGRCGRGLTGSDPQPLRHQVWELPDFQPSVTEYQQHRLVCACGCSSCGPLPAGVPSGQAGLPDSSPSPVYSWPASVSPNAGPRTSWSLILNQPAAPPAGWSCCRTAPPTPCGPPTTNWPDNSRTSQCSTWKNHRPSKARPRPGFGSSSLRPSPTSPAAPVGVPKCRSKCWRHVRRRDPLRPGTDVLGFGRPLAVVLLHLSRDFQALCDGPCRVGKRLGHDLLRPTNQLFALWQKVRDGTLSRCAFQ